MNWNLRTCARRGHTLYSPTEPAARALVHLDGPDGDLWRCLRCDTYTPADRSVPTGPVAQVPLVPRGRELRDLFVMRLLACERGIRGLLMVLLAAGAWTFHDRQHQLRTALSDATPHLRQVSDWLGVDLTHTGLFHLAQELLNVDPTMVAVAGFGLLGYGLLQLLEGTGLWLGKRWGEYVAVIATSAFIPLEVHEVIAGASGIKVGALVLNLAAVAWLVYNGRLFGLRGGHHAYLAARRGAAILDPATLPTTPDPAGHDHTEDTDTEAAAADRVG